MKYKILNVIDVYFLSNPLFCKGGGQNDNLHLRFRAKLQGVKMTSERWQHHVIFKQRLVGVLEKSVDFSNLCCIVCQWWPLKMEKEQQVCMPITQEVLKILLCPFRYWVLTHFPFGIFIFEALYGSVPEILEFKYGSKSKLYTFSMVKKQIWVTLHKTYTYFLLKRNVWRTNNVETRNVSNFLLSKQLHWTYLSECIHFLFPNFACL